MSSNKTLIHYVSQTGASDIEVVEISEGFMLHVSSMDKCADAVLPPDEARRLISALCSSLGLPEPGEYVPAKRCSMCDRTTLVNSAPSSSWGVYDGWAMYQDKEGNVKIFCPHCEETLRKECR